MEEGNEQQSKKRKTIRTEKHSHNTIDLTNPLCINDFQQVSSIRSRNITQNNICLIDSSEQVSSDGHLMKSFLPTISTLSSQCNFKTMSEIGQFSLTSFFTMSRQIVKALIELHTAGVMHLNLTTDNIVASPDLKTVKLRNTNILRSIGGDPRFTAPEQTGRTNRTADFRSDLYSLGVVFFNMLSGNFPFESDNVSNLMRYHIFAKELPLKIVNSAIPGPLSNIVKKMMEKDVTKRYQCAKGVLHDLILVMSLLQDKSDICTVNLGRFDCSDAFNLSQKLYGREDEFKTLSLALERANKGSFESVLITGDSGIGKSYMVMELSKLVFDSKGFIIRGKYDQVQAIEPYSAILEALRNFCSLILMEDVETLHHYKDLILTAIGQESKLLTVILPNLRLIIGEGQQTQTNVIVKDSKNRFIFVICNLIRSLCTLEHPIVFFVDDLQWADSESLEVLAMLISDTSLQNLLFVGIYRQDESNPSTNMKMFLDIVENKRVSNKIELNCLGPDHINNMVSDTLHLSCSDSRKLSSFLHEKTKGNPFFVTQLFRELVNDKIIFFNHDKGVWEWKLEQYDQIYPVDDITTLMRKKTLKLDVDTRNVLKGADIMSRAISEGFITTVVTDSTWYCFSHDYIQAAALSLIPEATRNLVLYNIAKDLIKKSTNEELDENVFTVVNLFNSASSHMHPQELAIVASLNLKAAKKAKKSAAFKTAMKYLAFGISLLNASSWSQHYDLCLQLYQNATETAYFLHYFKMMEKCVEPILKYATCTLHKIPSYSVLIWAFNDKCMYDKANTIGLNAFTELGEILPQKLKCEPRNVVMAIELDKLELLEDESAFAVMQIGSDIIYSSYLLDSTLYQSVSFRIVQLSLKRGISKYSSCGFAALATVFCSNPKYIKEGCFLGEAALQLQKKVGTKYLYPFVNFLLHYLVFHWKMHVHKILVPLVLSYEVGLEVGANDRAFETFATFCQLSFLSGRQLTSLEKNFEFCHERFNVKSKSFASAYQAVLNLQGNGNHNPAHLVGDLFDCNTLGTDTEIHDLCDLAKSSLHVAMIAYIFHEFGKAADLISTCREYKSYLKSSYFLAMYVFYEGLIALSLARESVWNHNWKTVATKSIDRFREWSLICPDNYQNKLYLLEAELAALTAQDYKAKYFFNLAVESSSVGNFTHEEALACEKFGVFCIESRNEETGLHYLERALRSYSCWGAEAKVDHLLKLHPELESSTFFIPLELDVQSDCVTAVSDLTIYTEESSESRSEKKVRFTF